MNDMFANHVVIAGTNIVVAGSSIGATREAGEPYHAGYTGGASVWWSWTAPRSGTATISTTGSSFDTLLGIYIGTSVSALTTVASNDDDPNSAAYTSECVVDVVSNQTYRIAVDGYGGTSGGVSLSVHVVSSLPPPSAPAWALPDPFGVTVNSSNLAGKVVLLDFWATWCGPCKVEIPDFAFLQDKYRADGLVIVGASMDSTSQEVIEFMATNATPLNYQIVMSDYRTEAAYGGINAIPTTFIIDRQNLIRKKFVGTQSRNTFENQIIPLLYGNTRLGCSRNGGQMVLCWRTNALEFTLESAANADGSWSTWPITPTAVNGTNTVAVPMTGAPRYFRLRLQY